MVESRQSHAVVGLLRYRHQRWIALGLAAALGVGTLYQSLGALTGPGIYQNDLVAIYVLGRAILAGVEPYQPIHVLAERYIESMPGILFTHPSPYAPTMGLLFLPMVLLSYEAASAIWTVFELGCLAAAIALLTRAEGWRLSAVSIAALTLAGFAWFPIKAEVIVANVSLLLLALYSAAYGAERSQRPHLVAVLVALSMLIKPLAWPVLVVYLLTRRWTQLAIAALVGASGLLVAAIAIGPASVWRYFLDVLPVVARLYGPAVGNGSIWTIATVVFQGTEPTVVEGVTILGAIVLPPGAALADLLTPLVPFLLLAVFVGSVVRTKDDSVRFGLAICASIIMNPTFWSHYLVLALLPLVQCFRRLYERGFPTELTNAALAVATLLFVPLPSWMQLATTLAGGSAGGVEPLRIALSFLMFVPVITVIALAFLLVRLGREDGHGLDAVDAPPLKP